MHLVRNRRWWRSSDGAWFAPKGIWRWRRRARSWCWNRIHKFSASSRFRDFGVRMPICIGQGTQSRNLRYGVRVLTTCLSTLVNFLTKSELTWFLKMGYLWWRNLWTRGWCPVVGTWFTRHVWPLAIFSVYLLPISCDNYIYRLQEFLQGIYLKISTDPSMASSWFLISTPLENLTSMPWRMSISSWNLLQGWGFVSWFWCHKHIL